VTRGIGWLETALGVTTTLLLMSAAVYGARAPLPTEVVAALMSLLAGFTVAFRFIAVRRWSGLDWLLCRRQFAARPPA